MMRRMVKRLSLRTEFCSKGGPGSAGGQHQVQGMAQKISIPAKLAQMCRVVFFAASIACLPNAAKGAEKFSTMITFHLTTYSSSTVVPEHSFFILNKGMNSGKPLDAPCPNCFVAICTSQEDRQLLFWTCWALWQSHMFEQHLIGSVIPFIRKPDLFHELRQAVEASARRREELSRAVKNLQRFMQNRKDILQYFQQMNQQYKNQLRSYLIPKS